ncbi:MAG: hypothetical protein RSD35_09555 [Oscillospiraceae bacterium]
MHYSETSFKGIKAHELSDGNLSLKLTDFGSKIQSIKYFGKEMLCQNILSDKYRLSKYGDNFENGELSGFDEMFPNISAGKYPDDPWRGRLLPDHGEVWSRIWESSFNGLQLNFIIDGICLPYRLQKSISISDDAIKLNYCVKNLSDSPIKFIWAAHPLFVIEDEMQLEISCCSAIMNVHKGQRFLGDYGEIHTWPISNEGHDMRILSSQNKCCNKYYVTAKLSENTSRLIYPSGITVEIKAPADRVPYIGVWTDEDGANMKCVAPEPCTGAYDTLEKANELNCISQVEPYEIYKWQLEIRFFS